MCNAVTCLVALHRVPMFQNTRCLDEGAPGRYATVQSHHECTIVVFHSTNGRFMAQHILAGIIVYTFSNGPLNVDGPNTATVAQCELNLV